MIMKLPDYPQFSVDLTSFIQLANTTTTIPGAFHMIAYLPNTISIAHSIINELNANTPSKQDWFWVRANNKILLCFETPREQDPETMPEPAQLTPPLNPKRDYDLERGDTL